MKIRSEHTPPALDVLATHPALPAHVWEVLSFPSELSKLQRFCLAIFIFRFIIVRCRRFEGGQEVGKLFWDATNFDSVEISNLE